MSNKIQWQLGASINKPGSLLNLGPTPIRCSMGGTDVQLTFML